MKTKYIIVEKLETQNKKMFRVVKVKNLIEPTPGELLTKSDVESYINTMSVDVHVQAPKGKKGGA